MVVSPFSSLTEDINRLRKAGTIGMGRKKSKPSVVSSIRLSE